MGLEGGVDKTRVVGMVVHSYGCLRQKVETHQLDIFENLKEMWQTASTVSLNIGILYLDESLMSARVSPVQSRQKCSSAAVQQCSS